MAALRRHRIRRLLRLGVDALKDEAGQRTEAQRVLWPALNTMTIFYAHRLTTVCLMPPAYPESYARGDDRGGRHVASPRLYRERG